MDEDFVTYVRDSLIKHDTRVNRRFYEKPKGLISASVLIPLFKSKGEIRVLLSIRALHLRSHAGQVTFPGGHEEESDSDQVYTALREAEEEIGLVPADVVVVAVLPPSYVKPNKFVTPVVGVIPENVKLNVNEDEVSDVFSLPLNRFLYVKDNCTIQTITFVNQEYYVFYFKDMVKQKEIVTMGYTAYYLILTALALCDSDTVTIEIRKGCYLNKKTIFNDRERLHYNMFVQEFSKAKL